MAPQPIPIRTGRPVGRRLLPRFAAAIGLLTIVVGLLPAESTAAPGDRLPDLRMGSIRDIQIQVTGSGRRLLRFTTTILNTGHGPFELRAYRTSASRMRVAQRIYTSSGSYRTRSTAAVARYAGDGHDHWHVQRVATFDLMTIDGQFLRSAAKIGFCFFDTNLVYPSLPRSPSWPQYRESGCGSRASQGARMGISVGWGDRYPWNFVYQWIDISRLRAGSYRIRAIVDKSNYYSERAETNNCAYVRLVIPSRGQPRILGRGTHCLGWIAPGTQPAPTPRPTPQPTPTPTPTEEPTPTDGG